MSNERRNYFSSKVTKAQIQSVREEIQVICKELGWIQFGTFEELADMLCLPNGDYIKQAIDKLRANNEILLQVWVRDMFISLIPNLWFYTKSLGLEDFLNEEVNNG